MDISTVTDGMTRKLGPLPTWAWVAIPAGAYVAWSYYQASREPDVMEPVTVGGSAGTVEEDYGVNTGGSYLPSYGAAPDGTSNLPNVSATPEFTNEQWFKQASNWLISEGMTPTDVITALNAYLYGTHDVLTAQQGDALQRAVMKYGTAPNSSSTYVPTIQAASDSALAKLKAALTKSQSAEKTATAQSKENAARAAILQKIQALETQATQLRLKYVWNDNKYPLKWRTDLDKVRVDLQKLAQSSRTAASYTAEYNKILARFNALKASAPKIIPH